jgi:hypothetical protein
LFNKGLSLQIGKYNQAIVYFDKASNRNPNYADALHGKTESHAKIKVIGTNTIPLIYKYYHLQGSVHLTKKAIA